MIDTTDTAPYISRRPSWADDIHLHPDAIVHSWTAPTVPQVIDPGDGERQPAPVELLREDVLYVNDDGVILDAGPERIFLLDNMIDPDSARRLARALLECCARIEARS